MTTSVVITSIIIIKIAIVRKIIIFTAIFIMIMNFIIFYLKLAKIHFTSNTQLIIIQDQLIQVRRPAIKYTILFKKRLQSNHQKAWVPKDLFARKNGVLSPSMELSLGVQVLCVSSYWTACTPETTLLRTFNTST